MDQEDAASTAIRMLVEGRITLTNMARWAWRRGRESAAGDICRAYGCENEARYTSMYCGIHDIEFNDGKGERLIDVHR